MTAIGINAASLTMQTGSFVSVTVSQVSVSESSNFGSVLSKRMNSTSDSSSETRTYSDIKPQKTEYNRDTAKAASKSETDAADISAQVEERNDDNIKAAQTGTDENNAVSDGADASKEVSQATAESKTEAVEQRMSDEDVTDLVNAIDAMITLLQNMAQMLETTVSKLQGSFEQLDISTEDMFDVKSLQMIVISSMELTDSSDFLINSDALDLLNSITQLVEETFESLGMDPEEFMSTTAGETFAELFKSEDFEIDFEELRGLKPDEMQKKLEQMLAKEQPEEAAADGTEGPAFTVTHTEGETDSQSSDDSRHDGRDSSLHADRAADTQQSTSTVTGAENFIRNLENTIKAAGLEAEVAEGTTVRDVVYQLVDAIKVDLSPENTSLEMHLTPENLGRVNLNIQSKDGVMTAQITTENEVSKEALESQLQILKDNIESQGLKVEAIEITVSNFSFLDSSNAEQDESAAQGRSRHGRRHGLGVDETDDAALTQERARIEREIMEQNGNTVNYVA